MSGTEVTNVLQSVKSSHFCKKSRMLKYKNLEQVTSVTFLLKYAIPDFKQDNYQESAAVCVSI